MKGKPQPGAMRSPKQPPAAASGRSRWARLEAWLTQRADLLAGLIIAWFLAGSLRIAANSALNSDEALHFVLAHQSNPVAVYLASLGNAHPPLVFELLYVWQWFGTAETWLRLLPVLSACGFLWLLYRWTGMVFSTSAALAALILAAGSQTLAVLAAQIRGYTILLCSMAGALYYLEKTFAQPTGRRLALSSGFLYLAILTHYSAAWFAPAFGVYSLLRVLRNELPRPLAFRWAASQAGALVLYAVLYLTHAAKLHGGSLESSVKETWLRTSYYQPGQGWLAFLAERSLDTFQFLLASDAAGWLALGAFLAGLALLAGKKRLALLLALTAPFLAAGAAAILGVYPYGGTRHAIFLLPFAAAGVGYAAGALARRRVLPVLAAAVFLVPLWRSDPKPHLGLEQPSENRQDIHRALDYVRDHEQPGAVFFVDLHTSYLLGYYLGRNDVEQVTATAATSGFYESRYGGYRIISATRWTWERSQFREDLLRLRQGGTVGVNEPLRVLVIGGGASLGREILLSGRRVPVSEVREFGPEILTFRTP